MDSQQPSTALHKTIPSKKQKEAKYEEKKNDQ